METSECFDWLQLWRTSIIRYTLLVNQFCFRHMYSSNYFKCLSFLQHTNICIYIYILSNFDWLFNWVYRGNWLLHFSLHILIVVYPSLYTYTYCGTCTFLVYPVCFTSEYTRLLQTSRADIVLECRDVISIKYTFFVSTFFFFVNKDGLECVKITQTSIGWFYGGHIRLNNLYRWIHFASHRHTTHFILNQTNILHFNTATYFDVIKPDKYSRAFRGLEK